MNTTMTAIDEIDLGASGDSRLKKTNVYIPTLVHVDDVLSFRHLWTTETTVLDLSPNAVTDNVCCTLLQQALEVLNDTRKEVDLLQPDYTAVLTREKLIAKKFRLK